MGFNTQLKKAVKEYYEWHSDTCIKPIKFVYNKNYVEALLVRFVDAFGIEMSSLMSVERWSDGHYDVTEFDFEERDYEDVMVERYENSGGTIGE